MNGDGVFNFTDIIYGVNYFMGLGPSPSGFCNPKAPGAIKSSAADTHGIYAFKEPDYGYTDYLIADTGIEPQWYGNCLTSPG